MATPGGVTAPDNPPTADSPPAPDQGPAAPGTGGLPTGVDGQLLTAAPGARAKVIKHGPNAGMARAPQQAPPAVAAIIAAGNRIAKLPYRYGGGHQSFTDSAYDCSGTASYALHGAGLVDSPMPSSGYFNWGQPGPGQWVTVATNPGHMFLIVAGIRFDTSGKSQTGSRWQSQMRPLGSYKLRHPENL